MQKSEKTSYNPRIIAAIITLTIFISIPIFTTLNVSAATPCSDPNCLQLQATCTTPADYSCNDYQKLVAFALQGNNRAVLNWDLNDPENWSYPNPIALVGGTSGAIWNNAAPKRVKEINIAANSYILGTLTGTLDVSGFTALEGLLAAHNAFTSIDVSDCSSLKHLTGGY
ncbi:MAG: hypothetical protein FWG70_11145, partial [Oscillospiraceae bacterium]|nr:hypothetical protein [Oscillospiraceae bacterium]